MVVAEILTGLLSPSLTILVGWTRATLSAVCLYISNGETLFSLFVLYPFHSSQVITIYHSVHGAYFIIRSLLLSYIEI